MTGSVARRLERLEAERDILRLAARYCHGADDADVETFLGVWEEDAVWDVGAHRFAGRGEIAEAVRQQWAATESMLHATANSLVEVGEDSTATGRHDVVSVAVLRDGTRMLTTGRYDDVYACGEAGWRIRERRATVTTSTAITR